MTDPQLCCPNFETCEYFVPNFEKPVLSPSFYAAPAITYSVLAFIFLILIVITLTNLRRIIIEMERLGVNQYLMMNFFILLSVSFKFGYLLDGPIQLIFKESQGIPIYTTRSLDAISIGFMNMNLAYASYTWIKLILRQKGKAARPYNIVKGIFTADLVFILIATVINIAQLFPRSSLFFLLMALTSLCNDLLFTYGCCQLIRTLEQIYDFDPTAPEKARRLKILIAVVALCALTRGANDLSVYVRGDWEISFNFDSYCNKNFGWSGYLMFIIVATDMIPSIFFLMMFRPEIKPLSKQNSRVTLMERNLSGVELVKPDDHQSSGSRFSSAKSNFG